MKLTLGRRLLLIKWKGIHGGQLRVETGEPCQLLLIATEEVEVGQAEIVPNPLAVMRSRPAQGSGNVEALCGGAEGTERGLCGLITSLDNLDLDSCCSHLRNGLLIRNTGETGLGADSDLDKPHRRPSKQANSPGSIVKAGRS